MRFIREAAGLLMVGALLGCVVLLVRAHTHLGAPALVYHCQPGQQVKRWWVPASSPEGRNAPGTLEWDGQREIASCTASTTLTAP